MKWYFITIVNVLHPHAQGAVQERAKENKVTYIS